MSLPPTPVSMERGEERGEGKVKLNAKRFWDRVDLLVGKCQHNCDALVIPCSVKKSLGSTAQLWLFRVELVNTVVLLSKESVQVCGGQPVLEMLEQLRVEKRTLHLILKDKTDDYKGNFADLVGKRQRIGITNGSGGKFVEALMAYLQKNSQTVDVSAVLAEALMTKDKHESKVMLDSALFASQVMKRFQKEMENTIEHEKKVTHSDLADEMLKALDDPSLVRSDLKRKSLDASYGPVIQSGGKFKLKLSAECDNEELYYEDGTIVVMMGFRYQEYCSSIARTFLINASAEQKAVYAVLISAFKRGLSKLKNGVSLHLVFEACMQAIDKCKRTELKKHFLKSCGWGIGLSPRHKEYTISRKSRAVAREGMTFHFQVGFENLVDKSKKSKGKKASHYSVILADTVQVTDGTPKFLTNFQRRMIDYQLEDEEGLGKESHANGARSEARGKGEEKERRRKKEGKDKEDNEGHEGNEGSAEKKKEKEKKKKKKRKKETSENGREESSDGDSFEPMEGRRVTRQSNRRTAKQNMQLEKARKEREKKQLRLREKVRQRLERLLETTGGDFGLEEETVEWKDPECYRDMKQVSGQSTRLSVDSQRECVICPVMDHMVPLHVSTMKNFSLSVTGDWTYLRLNFIAPVAVTKTNRTPKQPDVALAHGDCMFIKELTFRSVDGTNLQKVHSQLKALQKALKERAKREKENPIVAQDKLRRNTSNRQLVLNDLSVRPNLGGRKKGTGRLECHVNGLRFVDHKKQEVRVLFNNVKHAFFQPSRNTSSVVLHFELKNAIMAGKKASTYVQFYRDVIDKFEDLGRATHEYDGMRHEREEKKRINLINKKFADFVQKMEEVIKKAGVSLEFESPEMSVRMEGVPNKQNVTIFPTEKCLIALDDAPPFVISMKECQLVHLERVQFSLRAFDAVFVPNDLSKDSKRVCSIPREHLDTLQDFLNWQSVLFYESRNNLDWKELIKTIRENFGDFVEKGGWDFLRRRDQAEESAEDNDGSVYEPSGDDDGSEWDDDEYTEGSSEEEEEGEEEEEEEYYDSEEESGESWGELEKKAAAADQRARNRERNEMFQRNRTQPNPKRRRLH